MGENNFQPKALHGKASRCRSRGEVHGWEKNVFHLRPLVFVAKCEKNLVLTLYYAGLHPKGISRMQSSLILKLVITTTSEVLPRNRGN